MKSLRNVLIAISLICIAGAVKAALPTSDLLYRSLITADIAGVRKALAQGASATVPLPAPDLPSAIKTPLEWLLSYSLSKEDSAVTDAKRLEVAKLLLSRGAKLTGKSDELFPAIVQGHERVLRLLLDHGASQTTRISGYTPLELAYKEGRKSIQDLLVARGAPSLNEAERLQIDLVRGARLRHIKMIQDALAAGGEMNSPDPSGQTPLGELLSMPLITRNAESTANNLELLALFFTEWKANPAKGTETDTPTVPVIQWVQMNSFVEAQFDLSAEILDRLIRYGADVNATDFLKQTALHLAAEHGNLPACKVLLKAGARGSAKDYRGRTPLDLAKNASTRAFLRANQ